MKIKELRDKTKEELDDLLKIKRESWRSLRFRISNKETKDVRELRETKKTIAQILTLLKGL